MFNYLDLILMMGFAWIITGIIQLIINRDKTSAPAWPGCLLILIFGLTLLDNFIKPGMLPEPIIRLLFIVSRNSYFLIGPFLLFYTRSLLLQKNKKGWETLHLLPFLIMVIYTAFNQSTLIPVEMLPNVPTPPEGLIRPGILRDILSILFRAGYCFLVFRLIHRHAKNVPDFYSRKTMRNTLSWLYYLAAFYLILFVLNFGILLLPPEAHLLHHMTTTLVRLAPSMLFIFLFTIFAQNQSVPEDLKTRADSDSFKYQNSGMTSVESRQLFEQLNTYITASRLFIESDLTLNTLAEQMGKTRHHLSEVINRESGKKFYGYINEFRLKEFILAVQENRFPEFTILAIAFECGFKSQSAFYDLFKKKMGITPREYMSELPVIL